MNPVTEFAMKHWREYTKNPNQDDNLETLIWIGFTIIFIWGFLVTIEEKNNKKSIPGKMQNTQKCGVCFNSSDSLPDMFQQLSIV